MNTFGPYNQFIDLHSCGHIMPFLLLLILHLRCFLFLHEHFSVDFYFSVCLSALMWFFDDLVWLFGLFGWREIAKFLGTSSQLKPFTELQGFRAGVHFVTFPLLKF